MIESLHRMMIMAEMHGRDLIRRHVAIGLLVALPASFYLSSIGEGRDAVGFGGVAMAFAVGGATVFSALSSSEVDQRLVMGGYRPMELLIGRLLFLCPFGIVISGLFTALMAPISHPHNPGVLLLGVSAVAAVAVAFGIAVAAIVPRELEATLVLIGVVGVQLAVSHTSTIAKVLPFYGPRLLIEDGVTGRGAIALPLLEGAAYGVALLVLSRLAIGPRLSIRTHRRRPPAEVVSVPTQPFPSEPSRSLSN
ncbi:MAG TPA: hypothetical protein VME70_16470 [Mycobacteriales bacterium]|nr:hypothetical protein [Mycobacteriales bacterium]